jgi:hypothetical protein
MPSANEVQDEILTTMRNLLPHTLSQTHSQMADRLEDYPVVPANQLVDSTASAAGAGTGGGVCGGPIKAGLEAARAPSRRKPVGALRRRVVSRLIGSPFRGLVLPTMSQ